jgi:hypothetical protein
MLCYRGRAKQPMDPAAVTVRTAPRTKFGPVDVVRTVGRDGSIELRSRTAPAPHVASNGVWLRQWAAATPDHVFLAERNGTGGWRRLT